MYMATVNPYLKHFTLEVPFDFKSWESNPPIKKVIFNDPATIVLWSDGTKTVVKCQEGDTYSKELGLAMCISKKYLGNKGNFNEVFKKWIQDETPEPEEDFDIEPIEPEPEDITNEDLTGALYSYCGSIPCNDCKIPKDKEGGCISIASMDREELLKTYKKIKEDK